MLFFSPFLPFLTPKLRKKAENCESFAAFHTCSTQNAEFVNRHNSSGKTKNKQNAARPRQYSPFPPQKRRFLAQNHVAGTHAQTQNLQFFTSTIVFVFFFTNPPPFVHRDTTETLDSKSHPEISIKKFPKHPKIAIFLFVFSAVTSKQTIFFYSFNSFFPFFKPGARAPTVTGTREATSDLSQPGLLNIFPKNTLFPPVLPGGGSYRSVRPPLKPFQAFGAFLRSFCLKSSWFF